MNNISCPVVKHNFGQEMSRDGEDASPRQSADVYFRARSLKTGSNLQPAIIALEIISQKRGSLSGGGIGLDEGGQSPGKRKSLGLSSCGFAGIPGAAVCCALKDRGFKRRASQDTALLSALPLTWSCCLCSLAPTTRDCPWCATAKPFTPVCISLSEPVVPFSKAPTSLCFSFHRRHGPGAQRSAQPLTGWFGFATAPLGRKRRYPVQSRSVCVSTHSALVWRLHLCSS